LKENVLNTAGLGGAVTTAGLTVEPIISATTASDLQIACTVLVTIFTIASLVYSMILKRERLQDDREHRQWEREQKEIENSDREID
jgi:preprotein translocase subunit SecG